jgi:D-alanyl-D-alanine carboxypeptidase
MTRRRLPVVAAVVTLVLAAPAGAGDSPLAKRLARALVVPHVAQARTAAVAIDLQTGETVFSEHDALPLAPASNEKLAVAYGALVALGSGFRISTDVLGRGEQDGTTWRGSPAARRPWRPRRSRAPRSPPWRARCARPGSER